MLRMHLISLPEMKCIVTAITTVQGMRNLACWHMQGNTSQVQHKKELLVQEGVEFCSQDTISPSSVVAAAELEERFTHQKF